MQSQKMSPLKAKIKPIFLKSRNFTKSDSESILLLSKCNQDKISTLLHLGLGSGHQHEKSNYKEHLGTLEVDGTRIKAGVNQDEVCDRR